MHDWQTITAILKAEAPDQAGAIEARLVSELGGLRLTIPKRKPVSRADALREVRKAAGRVDLAASRLQVSRVTLYRRLRQADPEPGPRMNGRMIR